MQPTIDYEKLGLRIKETRISRNMTQDNLAQMVDCNVSHISNVENAHTKVSLAALLAIANALDTTIDYLLSDQYTKPENALDSAILKELEKCDNEKKERILKMIDLM
ncbi:MAG: helix-turn-helix transcriptional regulator [Roseburia sp.]|nr:helix-turn-helix transcriptional regulator [Roseburia sp.]